LCLDLYFISGVDFDDDEFPFHEEEKSNIKVHFLPFIFSDLISFLFRSKMKHFTTNSPQPLMTAWSELVFLLFKKSPDQT